MTIFRLDGSPLAPRPIRWTVFASIAFLLTIFFFDITFSANPESRILAVQALVERGSLRIDGWEHLTSDHIAVGGHAYSDKPPLSSFIVAALYFAAKTLNVDPSSSISPRVFIQILGNVAAGAIPFCILLFLSVAELRRRNVKRSGFYAVCGWFGGFLFVYSGTYFGHLLAAMFLVMAYKLLQEQDRPVLAGVCIGASFLSEYTIAHGLVIWSLQYAWNRRSYQAGAKVLLGFSGPAIVQMIYNARISGNPFAMPYQFVADPAFAAMKHGYGFSWPSGSAFFGLTLGTERGLFVYAPNLILVGGAYLHSLRVGSRANFFRSYLVSFSLAHILLMSSYYMWNGGWAYGPRHLTALAALWLYAGLPCIQHKASKFAFVVLSLVGLGWAYLSKVTLSYLMPEGVKSPLTRLILPSFKDGKINDGNILTLLDICSPSNAAWIYAALIVLFLASLFFLKPDEASGVSG